MTKFSRDYIKNILDCIRDDLSEAKWAIISIIAYFVVLNKFFYSSCPIVLAIGYPCPACGMTRAGVSLLKFEFKDAFEMQPFIFWWAFCAAMFIVNRYLLLNKQFKLLKWLACIGMIGMIVFYIWRMLMYYPGEPPMSYYANNLVASILHLIRLR